MKCYNMYIEGNGQEIDAIVAAHSEESALMVLTLEAHLYGIELRHQNGELDDIFTDPDIDIKIAQIEKMSYDTDVPMAISVILR